MFIGIAATIPDLPNLPGQGGAGPEVTLDYSSSNFCADASDPTLSDASPIGGVFSYTGVGTLDLNTSTGAIDISGSDPGNYTVIYTVVGVGSSNFPINIGSTINTTITGDSSTCIGFVPSPADLTAVSGYSNYEWFKDNTSVQNGTSNTYTPAFNVAGNFVYKVIITDSSLGIPCTATSSNFTFTVNALPTISISGTDFCAGQSTTLTATPNTGTFVWEVNTGSGYNVISGQSNNTISVSTAGDYRAKVTDGNGCTSLPSNGLDIEEFISPTVLITTAPGTTICTGDTATLTAEANGGAEPYTYLWSNSATTQAISVSPTTTTTYTVTVTDDNGCTGTASQEITASTAGTAIASINNDAAMSFNGTDSYVDVSDYESAITNGNITLSMWFKTSSTSQQYFIATSQTYGTACSLFMPGNASGQLWFRRGNNTGAGEVTAKTSNGYNDGNWHHVTCTSDANMKIYVDGVLDIQASVSTPTVSNSQFLVIGRNGSSGTLPFNGELDEVAIFNSALSSCDVKGIYEGSIGSNAGKAANLLDTNTTIPAPVYWNRMGDS